MIAIHSSGKFIYFIALKCFIFDSLNLEYWTFLLLKSFVKI